MTAAQSVLSSVSSVAQAQAPAATVPATPAATAGAVKSFQGTGGAAFAEQLIASGVKYVQGYLFGAPRPATELDFNRFDGSRRLDNVA